jgi:5-methyltetrahydrofolate--homocysteine methyltransferase
MPFDPNMKLTRENFSTLPPLCTDGAWGTEMQKLGAQPGQMCDIWNIDEPEKVYSVAKSYVDAGAHIILTNTFNSNRIVLAKHQLANRAYELTKAGTEISKRAALGKAYVFGSIGPCGKMVMMGEIGEDEVEESAAEQAKAMAAGGAAAIVIETQTDLAEAEAALNGCLSACDLPIGVSFTFDSGKDNAFTMMGVSPTKAYALAKRVGASFVGANCGAGIESFIALARLYTENGTDIPIWIKGNAGKPETGPDGRSVYSAPPELYAGLVESLLAAGARFIGGCCGSNPNHIRAIATKMESLSS